MSTLALKSAAPTPLRSFLTLAKSGIVTLVLISVGSGYALGHPQELPFPWIRFFTTLLGILCLSAGSSALNQLQERKIDEKMNRTSQRPLVSGAIAPFEALVFIGACLSLGFAMLLTVSVSVALLGLVAVASYNGLYTLWWKKRWAYAAIPGAIPGALPILMGYTAASDAAFAPGGLFLFSILFFWQMPHFWVLALKYKDDYARGGFPTLPVAKGTPMTVTQIALWSLAYVGICLLGFFFLPVGTLYLIVAIPVCAWVLIELKRFARQPETKAWLRFFLSVNFSLILILSGAVIDAWIYHWLLPYFVS